MCNRRDRVRRRCGPASLAVALISGLVLIAPPGCKSYEHNIYGSALEGNKPKVKRYLEEGQDINDTYTPNGWTPLHAAAHAGHDEMVLLLVGEGAYVDAVDVDGNTPLHLAAAAGHDGTVRALLTCRADPTIRNRNGDKPIDLAMGHREVYEALLMAGG